VAFQSWCRAGRDLTQPALTAAIILGTLRAALPATSPAVLGGIYTNLALMTVAFAAVHVVASLLDP
jgi:hypothetical protein